MVADFVWSASNARVIFGRGARNRVAQEGAMLGDHALVITTPGQAALGQTAAHMLGTAYAGHFSSAVMHVPMATVAAAEKMLAASRADTLVALGGGSSIGLAKILALRHGLPIIAVPTTFSGSEMTPIWGLTSADGKTTGRDAKVRPAVVIYDPDLLSGLPAAIAITSGFNAIAHACEGLYAADANPVISLLAREAIATLASSLPQIAAVPANPVPRARALYGSSLCGLVLGSVSMSLHHKLSHTLGGLFDLPHAALHTALLPHVLRYNAPGATDAMATIAAALAVADAPSGIYHLARSLGAKMALADLGMPRAGIALAAQAALTKPYSNPVPLDGAGIERLLTTAYDGTCP